MLTPTIMCAFARVNDRMHVAKGTICYINSLLQALASLPTAVEHLKAAASTGGEVSVLLYEMVCALSSRSKTKEVRTANKLVEALQRSGAWRAGQYIKKKHYHT